MLGIKFSKETEYKVGEILPINEKLAGVVPMALPEEQIALNRDIEINGLVSPVVLWHGKIVDGRCRQHACSKAGVPIRSVSLDYDMTEIDVIAFVKSANTRRNLTLTQKCIIAYKESESTKSTQKECSKKWGVSERNVNTVSSIEKYSTEYVERLFKGEKVEIEVRRKQKDGKYITVEILSDKLHAIAKYLKDKDESRRLNINNSEEFDWNPDSAIKTEAGKQWFRENLESAKNNHIKLLIEMANMKYSTHDGALPNAGRYPSGESSLENAMLKKELADALEKLENTKNFTAMLMREISAQEAEDGKGQK